MKSRTTLNSRRAAGLKACRSMNSGCASPLTARSPSSTPKRFPSGHRMRVCAQHRIPLTARSSASILCKIPVVNPAVCWPARLVARISPNSALYCPQPPFRHSPAKCGTRKKAARRARRRIVQQAQKQAMHQTKQQTATNPHSSLAVATHCVSTVKPFGNIIRAGLATRPAAGQTG